MALPTNNINFRILPQGGVPATAIPQASDTPTPSGNNKNVAQTAEKVVAVAASQTAAPMPSEPKPKMSSPESDLFDIILKHLEKNQWNQAKPFVEDLKSHNNTTDYFVLKALIGYYEANKTDADNYLNLFLQSKEPSHLIFPEKLLVSLGVFRVLDGELLKRCVNKLLEGNPSKESKFNILSAYASLLLDSYFGKSAPLKINREKNCVEFDQKPHQLQILSNARDALTKANSLKKDTSVQLLLCILKFMLNDKDRFKAYDTFKKEDIQNDRLLLVYYLLCTSMFLALPQKHFEDFENVIGELYTDTPEYSGLIVDNDFRQVSYSFRPEIICLYWANIFASRTAQANLTNYIKDLSKIIVQFPERKEPYLLMRAKAYYQIQNYEAACLDRMYACTVNPTNNKNFVALAESVSTISQIPPVSARTLASNAFALFKTYIGSPHFLNADINDNTLIIGCFFGFIMQMSTENLERNFQPVISQFPLWSSELKIIFLDLTIQIPRLCSENFNILEVLFRAHPNDPVLIEKLARFYCFNNKFDKCREVLDTWDRIVKDRAPAEELTYCLLRIGSYEVLRPRCKYLIKLNLLGNDYPKYIDAINNINGDLKLICNNSDPHLPMDAINGFLESISLYGKNKTERQQLLNEAIKCIKDFNIHTWLQNLPDHGNEVLTQLRPKLNTKEYAILLKQLGLTPALSPPAAATTTLETDLHVEEKKQPKELEEEKKIIDEAPSASNQQDRELEALLVQRQWEEQQRQMETEEKNRYIRMRQEAKRAEQQKKHYNASKLDVKTRPVLPTASPAPTTNSGKPPKNRKVKPEAPNKAKPAPTVINNIITNSTSSGSTETVVQVPLPTPLPPRDNSNFSNQNTNTLSLPSLSELSPYRKLPLTDEPSKKEVSSKAEKVYKPAPVVNPDVNRVSAAIRNFAYLNDLLEKKDFYSPDAFPRNKYFWARAAQYCLIRGGESLSSTSDQGQLSEEATKEIQGIINLEVAHRMRNDARNWFQCITLDKLVKTVFELNSQPIVRALDQWISYIDIKAKDPKTKLNTKKALNMVLQPLVTEAEKEEWNAKSTDDKRRIYLQILYHEFDELIQFPDSDKISRTHFCMYSDLEKRAVKMSVSIIDKCLDALDLNFKQRKKIKNLSAIIGHRIGEHEEIRFYNYEEIDPEKLYEFIREASSIKEKIQAIVGS